MKRRDFIQTSFTAAGVTALSGALPASAAETSDSTPKEREYFELRTYQLRRGPMQRRFDAFFRDAAIPAMNRAGLGPIGVFGVMYGPQSPTLYVLIPHRSIESLATARDRVQADPEFQKAGAEFIDAPATDPSYIRVESALMRAFDGMPKLEVPAAAEKKQPRIFELRIYESHSQRAHAKKVEMFNIGEIAIFRRTGLTPVFFGETLIGSNLPNLTYMLVFENMAAREKNWSRFVSDPEWKKLSATPGFTDPEIVTNITNVILRPTAYSQI